MQKTKSKNNCIGFPLNVCWIIKHAHGGWKSMTSYKEQLWGVFFKLKVSCVHTGEEMFRLQPDTVKFY